MTQHQTISAFVGIGLGTGLAVGVWSSNLWIGGLEGGAAIAQVTADGSFGSLVNGSESLPCTSGTCTITGGTLNDSQSALFHSLSSFSLSNPQAPNASTQIPSAALLFDPGVSDIIVRVTGGEASLINGRISASAGSQANVFLINPSGLSFGSGAQLSLGGNFVASTARELLFKGVSLQTGQATAPTPELLTVSAPIGLGFLSAAPNSNPLAANPSDPNSPSADITVQGFGNRLVFGSPDAPNSQFVNRIFQPPPDAGLTNAPNTTFALIGNGIELSGGSIVSQGGDVAIASIADGVVSISNNRSPKITLGYENVRQFSDISLGDRALIDVSAPVPGNITFQGENVSILGSSAVLSETLFDTVIANPTPNPGGTININAAKTVTISGANEAPDFPFNPPFHSYISVDASDLASSTGGRVNVQARNVVIDEGGQIGANNFGEEGAGLIDIAATETVELRGGSLLGQSGLFATTGTGGSGAGGTIRVRAEHFLMTQGAQVLTSSLNAGAAGSIAVQSDRVSLIGVSEPFEVPFPDGSVQTVAVPTSLQSTMGDRAQGRSGNLTIATGQLSVVDGAEITTGTLGPGDAGDIEIKASEVEVSGTSGLEGPSTILTTVGLGAGGSGGELTIESDQVRVLAGAQVAAGTGGEGAAGNLTVRAQDVLISGQTALGRSGLFGSAIGGTGSGGNLTVETNSLRVTDGGTISVSNFASQASSPFPPGQGPAGNLQVSADTILLSGQSSLSANVAAGDRGNITLDTRLLTLRDRSQITTNATGEATGGNIDINASQGFVLAVPSENSDITANAVFGDGGRVAVEAQQVLGLKTQLALTENSDITASSEFGVAGEILLETPDTVVRSQTAALPQTTEEPALAQGCEVGGSGRFVQSGRGGVSASPYGVLGGRDSLSDVSVPTELSASPFSEQAIEAPTTEATITEAQDWAINEQGDIMLLAAQTSEGERCLQWRS